MKTKLSVSALIHLFIMQFLLLHSVSHDFDFFYFVQQWPGAYCDTKRSCCYPSTGKPEADFSIHGLWPNYNDGSYPSNCDSHSQFDGSEISDLKNEMEIEWPTLSCPSGDGLKFWAHEWNKHGTCSESVLDQKGYFETALNLKKKVNLLGALKKAGIQPDGKFYSLKSISQAIREETGFTPGIECNVDMVGNSQLYQIYMCVDASGSKLIECPLLPRGWCHPKIMFPAF
ncbi:ribonuclease T2 [Ranunculus cassubicifolius]